jgi:hypothetical protein
MRLWLAFGIALPFVWLEACSSNKPPQVVDDNGGATAGRPVGSGSSSSGGVTGFASSSGPNGMFAPDTDGSAAMTNSGPCKGGHYVGSFTGTYASHLTAIGVPIPVTGNVDAYLDQQGGADQTCHPAGEIPVPCNQVFTLSDGTVTGVADGNDAGMGGFPYFCTMTGTLDCATLRLDEGWIQCTYCVGPLADGGMACQLLDGVLGTTGVGGHFAGPVTGTYDVNKLAFTMGTWNGAEALAGYEAGAPGPDGAPESSFLSDAGYYLGFSYGGLGTWTAAWQPK